MKRVLIATIGISLALNIYLGSRIVNQRHEGINTFPSAADNFKFTRDPDSTNVDNYIVVFKNGKYWWAIDQDIVSVNIGVNQGVTLRIDKVTGRVKSTTLELIDTNGIFCYYTDMNADGIPDKKRMMGKEVRMELFYNGRFVPSFNENGKLFITDSGTKREVKFNGVTWVAE